MTTLLTGKQPAETIRAAAASGAARLAAAGTPARLAVVTATDDEGTAWYVRSITKAAGTAGIRADVVDLGAGASADAIATALTDLSADKTVHGIILQTPLSGGTRLSDLGLFIDPARDVDGANPISLGRLAAGLPAYAPATAEAVTAILDHYDIPAAGQNTVIVGRSLVVGKPLAHLLLDRNATVTICHSRTRDLAAVTRTADILIAAVGRTALITPDHVRPGAVVIDVGTNPTPEGGLAGDVHPDVADTAAAFTPVPGGVGPVTTALLLAHTTAAATQLAGDGA